jgi:hypothetical protein
MKLYSKEIHNLYSSSNIIRVAESRRKRWAGCLTEGSTKFWSVNLKG